MATLPPLTEDLDDFVDVLNVAHERVKLGRELDPLDGCHEPPFLEFGDVWVLGVAGAAIVLGIAAVIVAFFDCLISGGLLAAGTVAALVAWSQISKNGAALRANREASVVLAGAVVQANHSLFDAENTDNLPAFFVVTFDDDLEDDAEALADLARRLGEELKDANAAEVPEEVREISIALTDEDPRWTRRPLAESWCGHPDTWVVDVYVERATLPRKVIDRRLIPLLVHPTDLAASPEVLAATFWWREDVDDLTEMLEEE